MSGSWGACRGLGVVWTLSSCLSAVMPFCPWLIFHHLAFISFGFGGGCWRDIEVWIGATLGVLGGSEYRLFHSVQAFLAPLLNYLTLSLAHLNVA